MLNQPVLQAVSSTRRTRSPRVIEAVSISDEQEGASFMAFLGEHQAFAQQHRGA